MSITPLRGTLFYGIGIGPQFNSVDEDLSEIRQWPRRERAILLFYVLTKPYYSDKLLRYERYPEPDGVLSAACSR